MSTSVFKSVCAVVVGSSPAAQRANARPAVTTCTLRFGPKSVSVSRGARLVAHAADATAVAGPVTDGTFDELVLKAKVSMGKREGGGGLERGEG